MPSSDALRRALQAPADPLRPLPPSVAALLETLDTPPRLAAHLRAVHDVAVEIVDWVERAVPGTRRRPRRRPLRQPRHRQDGPQ